MNKDGITVTVQTAGTDATQQFLGLFKWGFILQLTMLGLGLLAGTLGECFKPKDMVIRVFSFFVLLFMAITPIIWVIAGTSAVWSHSGSVLGGRVGLDSFTTPADTMSYLQQVMPASYNFLHTLLLITWAAIILFWAMIFLNRKQH